MKNDFSIKDTDTITITISDLRKLCKKFRERTDENGEFKGRFFVFDLEFDEYLKMNQDKINGEQPR